MKDRSHANRGQPLETFLRYANSRYQLKGVACITKQATEFIPLRDRYGRVTNVKVEHKSTVDFIGRYKHYPIAIEAKNSESDMIRFDRVEEHQADFMDDFTAPGTIGLVVVSFGMKRFFAIPWLFWSAAYDIRVRKGDRKAPATVTAHGVTWEIPQKFSVRLEELDPSWEIPDHDMNYGIDYLKNAKKYVVGTDATANTQQIV